MTTNILARIILNLVTNTVTTDNTVYEKIPIPCPDSSFAQLGTSCLVFHGFSNGRKLKDPTEKEVTTEVFEVQTVNFVLQGQDLYMELSRKLKSSTKQKFALKTEWTPTEAKK